MPVPDDRTQNQTAQIKAEARRLGFELVGVTDPSPPPHLDVYQQWLAAGRHGDMAYLASDRACRRRRDPRLILPECQSILVVGVNYLPKQASSSKQSPKVRVAAYARGDDYHEVLPQRLDRLVDFIEKLVGQPVPNRVYTDTGPILERELAQRAGLGWIGKNTCLINPRLGSYFVLAEVLLGIDLQQDQPFARDHCGTCTRCIEACPTSCILPDRTIDAQRCISYLTIEQKGIISQELRSSIGNWLFGCDICQQVCPWNSRFAVPTRDPAFQPRRFLARPKLEDFLSLSLETWSQPLRGSPMLRSRRRGLVRNAAIVAGNIGLPATLPYLKTLLQEDPEPIVRALAAWGLGQFSEPEAEQALAQAFTSESEKAVIEEIKAALDSFTTRSLTPH